MKFFKKFTFKVTFRLILILAVMIVIATIFGNGRLFFNQIILTIILMVQVFELFRFINYTNRELAKFLMAVKYKDFSVNFNKSSIGKSFDELSTAYSEIITTYKEAKIENAGHFHFLQMVISHINIGILTVENSQNILFINNTAEKLLRIEGIKNWEILRTKQPKFVRDINEISNNGRKLISLSTKGEGKTLSVDVNTMTLLGKTYTLITFQDIKEEIEQTEIEAWHKLIRILTHEIMNSATPISSLTETMQAMLEKNGQQKSVSELDGETINDLRFSLKTVQKRSDGILDFIDDYRKITGVPTPRKEDINIEQLLKEIKVLVKPDLSKKGITLKVESVPALITNLDFKLIQQVMLNMIKNAEHALDNIADPYIELLAYQKNGKTIIDIIDNGHGIPEKEINEIFVPFYTTKKTGSGIGLSLSKQIMYMHGGSIKVQSIVDKGTIFSLLFKG